MTDERDAQPRPQLGSIAGQLAAEMMADHVRAGGTVDIPSLGITLTKDDLPDDTPPSPPADPHAPILLEANLAGVDASDTRAFAQIALSVAARNLEAELREEIAALEADLAAATRRIVELEARLEKRTAYFKRTVHKLIEAQKTQIAWADTARRLRDELEGAAYRRKSILRMAVGVLRQRNEANRRIVALTAVVEAAIPWADATNGIRYVDSSYPPDARHAALQRVWTTCDALLEAVADYRNALEAPHG